MRNVQTSKLAKCFLKNSTNYMAPHCFILQKIKDKVLKINNKASKIYTINLLITWL